MRHVSFAGPDGRVQRGRVAWGDDGRIEAVEVWGEGESADSPPLLLVPGFIDLQLNGGFGHDFTADPRTIWEVAARLPRYGVTAFLPTLITAPPEKYRQALAVLAAGPPPGFRGALPAGFHFEGPCLNPAKKGAHNPAWLQLPSPDLGADWSREAGVWLVTLAPELPGAADLVARLVARGVIVSAGHSMATAAGARAALAAGVRYGTHLFNAMPPLHHREPGLAGALLVDDRPIIGLIADGVHLHPDLVRLVWQAVGSDRLNLVTDAMAALGMPDGDQVLGDFRVRVAAGEARLPDGTLAGSVLALDQAVRNLMAFAGCSLLEAVATVSRVPADLCGMPAGRIATGCRADLVLLDRQAQVVRTLVAGTVVYDREPGKGAKL